MKPQDLVYDAEKVINEEIIEYSIGGKLIYTAIDFKKREIKEIDALSSLEEVKEYLKKKVT